MSVIQVGLIDTTGQLNTHLVQATAAALDTQVNRDLRQCWNISATVRHLLDPKCIPIGVWPVFLVDKLPPGEGGVHLDKKRQPDALVIATPENSDWTIDASRVTLEMLINPSGIPCERPTATSLAEPSDLGAQRRTGIECSDVAIEQPVTIRTGCLDAFQKDMGFIANLAVCYDTLATVSFRSMYLRITAVRDVCVQLAAALMIVIASTAPAVSAARNDRIWAAETAALSWLAQIDVGAYDDGWEQATGLIHHRDKATWTGWMRERRGALGDLLQRTTVYAGPIRFSRNEPDGEYLEIEYDTTFSGLSHLFEYVRMVRGEDGVWRIYWYFVRQRSPTELSQVDHK